MCSVDFMKNIITLCLTASDALLTDGLVSKFFLPSFNTQTIKTVIESNVCIYTIGIYIRKIYNFNILNITDMEFCMILPRSKRGKLTASAQK